MIEVKYDIPIEVTEKQFRETTRIFAGSIASRKEYDKFYIKLWNTNVKAKLEFYLNQN